MTDLTETAAEIAALIPRHSWLLMDEEQRDILMRDVVLPRYMDMTADGIQLGPTWWAAQVGASPSAVKNRIQRLQASQISHGEQGATSEPEWKKADRRAARQLIREAPAEQIEEIIASLPREAVAKVAKAVSRDYERRGEEAKKKSEKAFREEVGDSLVDEIVEEQRLRDAESKAFDARRALRDMLILLNEADLEDMRPTWREDFLKTLDDLSMRVEVAKSLLGGTLDQDLQEFLQEA